MAGLDWATLKPLDGIPHIDQSVEVILTTRQGEMIEREWFGNPGLKLLGENATAKTILLWFTILWMLIELFEPRRKITRFVPNSVDRLGGFDCTMEGLYRPYAHLDWQQAAAYISVVDGAVRLESGT